MLTNSIEITLIVSDRTGILPLLMRKLSTLDLIYRRCVTNYDYDDGVKLTLVCNGDSDYDYDAQVLTQVLEKIPNVDSVVSIFNNETGAQNSSLERNINYSDYTELQPLRANDPITQDVMHIVHDRLSESYGPTLDILVSTAAKKSKRVGELFLILAENLDHDQRMLFLRDIEDLEYMSPKFS